MSSRVFVVSDNLAWKKAYLAAVLEGDCTQVPKLVQKAKEQLFQRMDELLASDRVPLDELEAIHDALYFLDALLSSLPYRDDLGQWTEQNTGN